MIDMMISLMQRGIHVAVVTAAGYPGEPLLFEARIKGLLDAFKARALPPDVTERFLMLGGECNYLLRCSPPVSATFNFSTLYVLHACTVVPSPMWRVGALH